MERPRLGILISGESTTAEYMVRACQNGDVEIDAACVISSRADAPGVARLKNLGFVENDNLFIINPREFGPPKARDQIVFGKAIIERLENCDVTVVHQSGWNPLTPENVVKRYAGNIYMQHPGPIPYFGGKGMNGVVVHEAVLQFIYLTGGSPYTEVVVQRVGVKLDGGVVVKRVPVPILNGDTAETLSQRAKPYEHRLQVSLLQDIVQNRVRSCADSMFVKPGEEDYLELAKEIAIRRHSSFKIAQAVL